MKFISFTLLLLSSIIAYSQDIGIDDLLNDIQTEEEVTLLPERMLITQRMMWGENGLYRKIGIAPRIMTAETRERELKVRRNMFRIHQIAGLVTAGGMIAQGILGTKLYNGDFAVRQAHSNLATGINIGYATTALMAFTSPPPLVNRKKFDNIKLHKILSGVHLSGMVATNILSEKASENLKYKPWHRAAAFTTFGAYTAAIVSIKLEF
jgi:hypothetical protein